jgi:hypothetical protein
VSRSPSPDEARAAVEQAGAEARSGDFWDARRGLALIRDWARSRRASPYAVLGEVVAGAICRTQPAVRLPSLIGGPGSLNSLFAMVGPSGEGKGAAAACSLEAVDWAGVEVDIVMLGTGEGVVHTFGAGRKDKQLGYEVIRTRWRALLVVREIDHLGALMARQGATVSPVLRQVYSGEELGFGNAEAERRVIIPRHEYRGCVTVGVQPGRGETLLADADGGLPQRFCWLPTTDPDIPDQKPDDPSQIQWKPAPEIIGLADHDFTCPRVMDVCLQARDAVDQARVARMRGQGDALDGHALYTREKVAAGLALYDGRLGVSEEDWQLAGHLMFVSDITRQGVTNALRRAQEHRNRVRGESEAARARIVARATETDIQQRVADRIKTVLRKRNDWVAGSRLRGELRSEHRSYFRETIEALCESGAITARDTAPGHGIGGTAYRLKDC